MDNSKMKIFIGSSSEAADKKDPYKNYLLQIVGILDGMGVDSVPWDKSPSVFKPSKTTIENLEEIVVREHIKASIFIYSEDDKTWSHGEMENTTRDNVLFEQGLFTGILGRAKVMIVKVGNVKIPSDLLGLTIIDYNSQGQARLNIMKWVKDLIDEEDNNHTGKILARSMEDDSHPPPSAEIEFVPFSQGTYRRIIDNKEIKITTPFSISKYLITQSVYDSIMGYHRSSFEGDSLPVENITFLDAIAFCNKLSVKEGYQEVYTIANEIIQWNEKVKGYRLPFEIEWEYALGYSTIEIQENLDTLAWYNRNSGNRTHDVGQKKGNRYGLFDLLGNVWEWCYDNYKEDPSQTMMLENNSKLRVLRGGSFADFETMFAKEKAFRKRQNESILNNFTGFRIVLQDTNLEG